MLLFFHVILLSYSVCASLDKIIVGKEPIPVRDHYIVELHAHTGLDHHCNHDLHSDSNVVEKLEIGNFKGYIVRAPTDNAVDHMCCLTNEIRHIHEDGIVGVQSVTLPDTQLQRDVAWNLARISSRFVDPKNMTYEYPVDAGRSATIYIMDSGIDQNHSDFKSKRVTLGPNFIGFEPNQDKKGHGTNVASIAAGSVWGVAKLAKIVSVKVLDANGVGSWANILLGMQAIVKEHLADPSKIRIINLSLSGTHSQLINNAVEATIAAGVYVIAAAGNSADHACNYSPSSAGGTRGPVITVGAINDKNEIAPFSNFGECVDIFAPGVKIPGAQMGTVAKSQLWSGTSQASPSVAGVVALILSDLNKNYTQLAVKKALRTMSTKGQIVAPSFNATDPSPNHILYNQRKAGNWEIAETSKLKTKSISSSHVEL